MVLRVECLKLKLCEKRENIGSQERLNKCVRFVCRIVKYFRIKCLQCINLHYAIKIEEYSSCDWLAMSLE